VTTLLRDVVVKAGQDKSAEMTADIYLEEWLPDELDAYLDAATSAKCRILDRLGILAAQDKVILDGGCGPGTFGLSLARGNRVLGIDISWRSVRHANRRSASRNVRFAGIVADLERLPFAADSFDICFCGWVLHHFPDFAGALSELNRVLRPGGLLAIVEPNESNPVIRASRFFEDLFKGLVVGSGLDVPNRQVHTPSSYSALLDRSGFIDIRSTSTRSTEVPVLPKAKRRSMGLIRSASLMVFLSMRRFLFRLSDSFLSSQRHPVLLIVAKKPAS